MEDPAIQEMNANQTAKSAQRRSAADVCTRMRTPRLVLKDEVVEFFKKWYSDVHLENMLLALGTPPRQTTVRVNTIRTSREHLIERLKDHMKQTGDNRFNIVADSRLPDLITIEPKVAACEPKPEYPPLVIGCKAGESVMRGAHLYAVGVLGVPPNLYAGTKVSVVTDVASKTLKGSIIEEFDRDCCFIGNGIAQFGRTVMFNMKEGVGVTLTEPLFNHPPLHDVFPGELYLQNFPSMLVAHLLDPKPGETIIDLCAAPGGKTTHVSALMKDQGKIYALDKNKTKVKELEKTTKRWGINSIIPMTFDATKAATKFPAESFDRIVLDPPCSGMGNRPRFLDEMSARVLSEHADYQRRVFVEAMKLLKVGGTLVYSTCTINPQENEETVQWALDTYPTQLELVDPEPHLKFGLPGLKTANIKEENRVKVLRFDPSDKEMDTMGFFAAKFRKSSSIFPQDQPK